MMSARRLKRDSPLAFEALSIEGGLLSPEWLAKVAQLEAPQQAPADYGIEKGLQLRDEIGRYWRIAEPKWRDFVAMRAAGSESRAAAESFVTDLLRKVFGFGSLAKVGTVTQGERSYPIGWTALGGQVPVVIAGPNESEKENALDKLADAFGDETRRRTPFGLCQEFLNATESAMWGVVSDGLTLRVLRDNASLTRPAWIEADLEAIFGGGRFADFAALWLLLHQSRFGREGQPPSECALEQWRTLGREEGTRARDQLREGVEAALRAMGQGFLAHRENTTLREALHTGLLTEATYFQQLLRLVYRLIFVLTVEERELLHPAGTPSGPRELYTGGYSLRALRERVVRRSAHDRHHDAWEAMKVVFRGLATGQPTLGLPALGGLFATGQCADLDASRIENRYFLQALYRLCWLQEQGGLARVNWRDMGPEELGSVYESLLELTPRVVKEGREFTFAEGAENKGNAKKTTGSYYTPEELVQVLLDSALEPVMTRAEASRPQAKAEALLELTIVDPACGSGHFLLAAARRLAARIAQHEANGTASPMEFRHAVRRVVSRCIFGVDLNPLAVELCKVGLWMEAVEPGLPLSFLDSHVQCGNALLGTMPGLLDDGIPDEAWTPIGEDDRQTAKALKKRNKAAKKQGTLALGLAAEQSKSLATAVAAIDRADDADTAALAKKEADWNSLQHSKNFELQKLVADAWCASFVWPKPQPASEIVQVAPTEDLWRELREGKVEPASLLVETVRDLAARYQFFHWQIAFPQVFARGGFDVVLGNPPWEHTELVEKEWFAERCPEIARARTGAERKLMIDALRVEDPSLHAAFMNASRDHESVGHFLGDSGRFPLCGRGRINFYAVFAEGMRKLLNQNGRLGCVLPTGIATDDTTKLFFQDVVGTKSLVSLFDFENKLLLFPAVAPVMKFCLFTCGSGRVPIVDCAEFLFFAQSVEDLRDADRRFTLTSADIALLNPNTGTCPIFRSQKDASLTKAIYRRVPVLIREAGAGLPEENPWGIKFKQGLFNMTSDSHLFRTREELESDGWRINGNIFEKEGKSHLPLYEAKLFQQFNHRFGTFDGIPEADRFKVKAATNSPSGDDYSDPDFCILPRYWVDETEVLSVADGSRAWHLAFRDMTNVMTNSRNAVFCVLPFVAVGHSAPIVITPQAGRVSMLCAAANSFVFDYLTRQSLAGAHLTFFILKQLPVPRPESMSAVLAPWEPDVSIESWVRRRVLELTYTSYELSAFADDIDCGGSPFCWDSERRAMLRCELDAAFFHLYGLSREETAYVMDTFRLVRSADERDFGEYRTKRLILERFDALAEASKTGKYESPLNPPPGHDSIRHPARESNTKVRAG